MSDEHTHLPLMVAAVRRFAHSDDLARMSNGLKKRGYRQLPCQTGPQRGKLPKMRLQAFSGLLPHWRLFSNNAQLWRKRSLFDLSVEQFQDRAEPVTGFVAQQKSCTKK